MRELSSPRGHQRRRSTRRAGSSEAVARPRTVRDEWNIRIVNARWYVRSLAGANRDRQRDLEGCPLARSVAVAEQLSMVRLNDCPCDGQADAASRAVRGTGGVAPVEALEQVGGQSGVETLPRVGHRDPAKVAVPGGSDRDDAPRPGMSEGVVQQGAQRLGQPIGVDQHLAAADAAGISLSTEGGVSGGKVLVDPDRLAEALGALLDNALRHTGTGGVVTIAATRHGDLCRIVVTDTGEGFDPGLAPHLFERFYRGDSSRTANGAGSGIGLTIARAIVQAHHGQLLGHSDGPGKGATFEITLPIPVSSR